MPRARRLPAAARRRQILETARATFAQQGYEKTSTADLARAAGLSEAALYRHFAGKKELFLEVIRSTGPKLLDIWEDISYQVEDPVETLWAIGVHYYDHLRSHSANMKLQFRALSDADDPDIREALRANFAAFVDFVSDTLEEGKVRGIVRREVDSRLVAWQFLGIGLMLDTLHLLGFDDEIDRRGVEQWGRLYLDAIRARPTERRRNIAGLPFPLDGVPVYVGAAEPLPVAPPGASIDTLTLT
ncbi:MAG TPA: TetR/AcrR family transcriptional regulator [Dehalococcoidia bacterium]|nr:TetR/AcrR family transcriptional regulator [Dehalococcoidia bacterium]